MNVQYPARRHLGLETLESRTLLAGGFGFEADFTQAIAAVSGTGDFAGSFSTNFGNKQLVLTGHGDNALTINLDLLPAFVTHLNISSFADVTFIGMDRVDNLIVSDVDTLIASQLSVTKSLHATDVGSIDLASAGTIALLKGMHTNLTVHSLGETMVISDLQSLTIDSESRSLYVVGLNSNQTLNLHYSPDSISLAGLSSEAIHFIAAGGTSGPTVDNGAGGVIDAGIISTPTSPTTIPDTVLVISVPLDPRTRAFIAELLLHTSPTASQGLVVAFANHTSLQTEIVAAATAVNHVTPIDSIARENILNRIEAPQNLDQQIVDLKKFEGAAPAITERPVAQFTDLPLDMPAELPESAFSPASVIIDATWPVALARSEPSEGFRAATPVWTGSHQEEEVKLEDSVAAFGNYIVERVAAEFSPGEQSHILLVDPRPTRPSASAAPVSAMDMFARGNRAALAASVNKS